MEAQGLSLDRWGALTVLGSGFPQDRLLARGRQRAAWAHLFRCVVFRTLLQKVLKPQGGFGDYGASFGKAARFPKRCAAPSKRPRSDLEDIYGRSFLSENCQRSGLRKRYDGVLPSDLSLPPECAIGSGAVGGAAQFAMRGKTLMGQNKPGASVTRLRRKDARWTLRCELRSNEQ